MTTAVATHADLYRRWQERSGLPPLEDADGLSVDLAAGDYPVGEAQEVAYIVDCAVSACMLGEGHVPRFADILYAAGEYLMARPEWAQALHAQVDDMPPSARRAACGEVLVYLGMVKIRAGRA